MYAPEGVTASATVTDGRTELTLTTPRGSYDAVALALRGRHQIDNAVTAVRLLEELPAATGLRVPDDAVRTAVEGVEWPARLELRQIDGHEILIDGAHNPGGARALAVYLQETCTAAGCRWSSGSCGTSRSTR